MLREALTTIANHPGAEGVCVRLRADPATMRLTIEDDGNGFGPTVQISPGGDAIGGVEMAPPSSFPLPFEARISPLSCATFARLDSQGEGPMRSICARFTRSVGSPPPLSDCLAPMEDGLAGWRHTFPYRGGDAVVARLQRGWRVEVAGRAAVARTLVEAFEAVLQRDACRDEVQVVVAALVRDQAIH